MQLKQAQGAGTNDFENFMQNAADAIDDWGGDDGFDGYVLLAPPKHSGWCARVAFRL